MLPPSLPSFLHEDRCPAPVCGIDEVGRGPWAGPVVAAAVVLDPRAVPDGLNDSKLVPRRRREALAAEIQASALVGIGLATVEEIAAINILQASLVAMVRAVAALGRPPAFALIDGNQLPLGLPCPAKALPQGDGTCLSIAAASIVAKVHRDRLMTALAAECPGYGWETNMGYGTPEHAAALDRLGITRHHRQSFRPVARLVERETASTTNPLTAEPL